MRPRVVILGAGYAGISAAKRLAGTDAKVTVINPRAVFVERIRLHQLVAGTHQARLPLRQLLPSAVSCIQASASAIDTARRGVRLDDGTELGFDYLVYALGSTARIDTIPGAERHAVGIGEWEAARTARARIRELRAGAPLTVVGGGLTGLELATELAGTGPAIRLVTSGALAPSVSVRGRAYLREHLRRSGVQLLEETEVVEVGANKIRLAEGDALESELTVLTTAFATPSLAADSGLDTAANGALLVRPDLVSTSSPRVIGAGDAALLEADPLRMSCQAAIPLGTHAAESVLAMHADIEPRSVRPKYTGQCISLGRGAALWQLTNRRDVPRERMLTGRAGATVKEGICSGTTRLMLNPRLPRVRYSWS